MDRSAATAGGYGDDVDHTDDDTGDRRPDRELFGLLGGGKRASHITRRVLRVHLRGEDDGGDAERKTTEQRAEDGPHEVVRRRAGGGLQVQSVQAIHRATDNFEGQILVYTGVDGVTSIDDIRVNNNRVIVTVTANGAKRTWTYSERPGSDVWGRE